MADTVTIRLNREQRRLFDAEALARGVGPSTLARILLGERLRQLRREWIARQSAQAAENFQVSRSATQAAKRESSDYSDGLDSDVWFAMAPYEGTVGGRRP